MDYYYRINTNAAPFFSDTLDGFVKADDPQQALAKAVYTCDHPAGVFSAAVWKSSDAYHKNGPALAKWLSERAIKQQEER